MGLPSSVGALRTGRGFRGCAARLQASACARDLMSLASTGRLVVTIAGLVQASVVLQALQGDRELEAGTVESGALFSSFEVAGLLRASSTLVAP